jgi:hypothetical protein
VSLNTVDNAAAFLADVRSGRWDVVLPQVALLHLPRSLLEDLYELVVLVRLIPPPRRQLTIALRAGDG